MNFLSAWTWALYPSGWSKVAGKMVRGKGGVLGADILPMDDVANVDFIQGDFTDENIVKQLLGWLGGGRFNLIISEIAPGISGIAFRKESREVYLAATGFKGGQAS